MKLSETGYVTTKIPRGLLDYTYEKCVPTGKTRVARDGEIEAQFILISGDSAERYLWLRRTQVW